MKPIKYSSDKASIINLGTKIIYKFPAQTKLFELSRMVVSGRHPENPKEFILESDCHFMIYVTKGSGKIYAGDDIFQVVAGMLLMFPRATSLRVKEKILNILLLIRRHFIRSNQK